MRLTEAVIVDPQFRAYRAAQTLTNRINGRLGYLATCQPQNLTTELRDRANTILHILALPTSQIPHSLLDTTQIKSPSVKALMKWIFANTEDPPAFQRSEYIQQLLDTLRIEAKQNRCSIYKFLMQCEIAYQAKRKAFIIFNTLTVAPEEYTKVFSKGSTAFKEYIRRINKRVVNHKYFAVIEEGAQHGRLHIHVLHFMDTLPREAADPNLGRTVPRYRLIDCLRKHWPHGHSAPVAVRYSPLDAYGLKQWRWPHDIKTDKPLVMGSPQRIASYISKYITKSYDSEKRSSLLWRVRKTHKIGLALMHQLVSQLSRETLIIIATIPTPTIKLGNTQVPPSLLRLAALRQLMILNQNSPPSKTVASSATLLTLAQLLQPRQPIVRSPRDLTNTIQQNNQQNTTFLQTIGINDTATFDTAVTQLKQAVKEINANFFQSTYKPYGATSTRDTIY